MPRARTVNGNAKLYTIPISHYCEKARWALELAHVRFEERAHFQVLHVVAARRAGGGQTVPVLVSPDGVFADSSDILEYADRVGDPPTPLFPNDPELEQQVRHLEDDFDRVLGPHGRLWMYSNMLHRRDLIKRYGLVGIPNWQRWAIPIIMPVSSAMIVRHLGINEKAANESLGLVQRTFDSVAERLSDGREYLVGDHFTAADLTFAALSAAVLAHPGYGVPLPQPDELPASMAAQVNQLREHPAGQFASRLYDEHRRPARASKAPAASA